MRSADSRKLHWLPDLLYYDRLHAEAYTNRNNTPGHPITGHLSHRIGVCCSGLDTPCNAGMSITAGWHDVGWHDVRLARRLRLLVCERCVTDMTGLACLPFDAMLFFAFAFAN